VDLWTFMASRGPRVSYETVLSGPGLVNIFQFLTLACGKKPSPLVRERMKTEDPGAVIGQAGVEKSCAVSSEAVDMFVRIYGAQAGNLALATMALGGVYVGGGIATKILPRLADGAFMESFLAKGRYSDFMKNIPVRVILDARTSLVGAAQTALELALDG
jgi:glucokinase